MTEILKDAIKRSGLTSYAIWKASGIRPHIVDRFMKGERDLRLATVDKLAELLGLELTPTQARPPQDRRLRGMT